MCSVRIHFMFEICDIWDKRSCLTGIDILGEIDRLPNGFCLVYLNITEASMKLHEGEVHPLSGSTFQ